MVASAGVSGARNAQWRSSELNLFRFTDTKTALLLLASCRRCLLLGRRGGFLEGGGIQLVLGVIPGLRPLPSAPGGGS